MIYTITELVPGNPMHGHHVGITECTDPGDKYVLASHQHQHMHFHPAPEIHPWCGEPMSTVTVETHREDEPQQLGLWGVSA